MASAGGSGKRINAKRKIERRLGVNLWGSAKSPFEVRNYPPGIHGPSGRRGVGSDYKKQLDAKQKLKKYYGNITEKQFLRTYKEATRLKGDTGESLIGLLESRLDAIIYRAKLAPTVFSARQLVSHKHVTLNGKVTNVASCQVKPGDVVEIRQKSQQMPLILEAQQSPERDIPDYLTVDEKKKSVSYVRRPILEEVPYPVMMEPNLVIEFYSR